MATKTKKGLISWIGEVDVRQVPQGVAGYTPYGADAKTSKGCATCQWFIPADDACVLVAGDIAPGGVSNFFTPKYEYKTPPLLVKIVEDEILTGSAKSEKENNLSAAEQGIVTLTDRIGSWVKGLWSGDPDSSLVHKTFSVYKTKEGLRFFVVYSNIFKDAHQEIISTAAHEEYCAWVTKTKNYPELQVWHSGPASCIGRGDFVDFVDGFAVGSGLINPGSESIAESLAQQDSGVSHGFIGITSKADDSVYVLYRPFEWSVLPAAQAANAWTDYSLSLKELEMPFSPEKVAYLKGVGFADTQITDMETKLKSFGENLKANGVAYKETGLAAEKETAAVAAVVASVPAASAPIAAVSAPPASSSNSVLAAVGAAEVDANGISALVKELVAGLAARDEVISTLATSVKSLTDSVAQLKKPVDDQFADLLKATIDTLPQGHQASKSASNLVDGGAVNAQQNPDFDWFFTNVVQPISGAPAAAGV